MNVIYRPAWSNTTFAAAGRGPAVPGTGGTVVRQPPAGTASGISGAAARSGAVGGSHTQDVVIVTYGRAPDGMAPAADSTRTGGPDAVTGGRRSLMPGAIGEANRPGDTATGEVPPSAAETRDAEVRRHEAAHMAVLGGLAGGPVVYKTVRDAHGRSQAVGAELKVDLAEVPGNPRETLRKARRIQMAATAPGSPSAADTRVAAEARRLAQAAAREIEAGYRPSAGTRPGELVDELV